MIKFHDLLHHQLNVILHFQLNGKANWALLCLTRLQAVCRLIKGSDVHVYSIHRDTQRCGCENESLFQQTLDIQRRDRLTAYSFINPCQNLPILLWREAQWKYNDLIFSGCCQHIYRFGRATKTMRNLVIFFWDSAKQIQIKVGSKTEYVPGKIVFAISEGTFQSYDFSAARCISLANGRTRFDSGSFSRDIRRQSVLLDETDCPDGWKH